MCSKISTRIYNFFESAKKLISSSGKDGFFDLTHVGTGERLKVQESWAKYYPKIEDGRDCVIAYLGKLNILHKVNLNSYHLR